MRKSILTLFLLLFIPTTSVQALALADIDLSSGLDEPLDARIPLRALQATDMETIRVKLADTEHFTRANLERLPILGSLRFKAVQNPDGTAHIGITTDDAINEPFLSFIVEVNWSRGRILREYTLLLDPPTYTGAASTVVKEVEASADEVTATAAAPASKTTASATTRTAPPTTSPVMVDERPEGADTSRYYGPVASQDTLWSLANRLRPNKSVSIEQMMLALQQHNPEAFLQNNINALRAGSILRIPDPGNTATIPQNKALTEVKRQHTAWENFRQKLAANPTAVPSGTPLPSAETKSVSTETERFGRIEILSAGTAVEGVGQTEKDGTRKLHAEIALAKEEIDAKGRENKELRARLTEAEDLIKEFVHLMEIQSDEINALKKKLAETESKIALESDRAEPQPTESELEALTASQVTSKEEETEDPAPKMEKTAETAKRHAPDSPSVISEPSASAKTVAPVKPSFAETAETAALEPDAELDPKPDSKSEEALVVDRIDNDLIDNNDLVIIVVVAGIGGILILFGGRILWLRRRREIAEVEESTNARGTITEPTVSEGDGAGAPPSLEPVDSKKASFQKALPEQKERSKFEKAPRPGTRFDTASPMEGPVSSALGPRPGISETDDATPNIELDAARKTDDEKSIATSKPSSAKAPSPMERFDPVDSGFSEPLPPPAKVTETKSTEGENLDLDFGFDLDVETSHESPAKKDNKAQIPEFPFADMSDTTIDEMQTKLDLAQAYIDMGDAEGARNILDKVLEEGSQAHQDIARELLEKLD
uniref:FimV N-terminal domain-containing protein n=1 Tax=Candidatus Kentrum sp. LFY TaxID=2126342 RepID=A0A450WES7_9GAMM|nr:MAG: FimV N-terminal domain-containing protein [Candidatus Kentron sp. LFY]